MKTLSVAGDRVTVLLSGEETGNAYTLMEIFMPPGGGPPPHMHHREDEGFLVMEGEVTFYLGEETRILKRGEYIFAPRGTAHHFRNTGSSTALIIATASPAGIEKFFEEVGMMLENRAGVPVPLTAEAVRLMVSTAPKYGIDILVP